MPRGGSASDELLAKNLENAARLAMRDLGGVEIDLRVYGTAGNASKAAAAASQAVNEGAKIILGPVYGEAANAAGVAAAQSSSSPQSSSSSSLPPLSLTLAPGAGPFSAAAGAGA